MVRSEQPTGVLIPVVYLFGEESKAKNLKVTHEYAEHREHGEFYTGSGLRRAIPYVQLSV
jgi:hypothetical protein